MQNQPDGSLIYGLLPGLLHQISTYRTLVHLLECFCTEKRSQVVEDVTVAFKLVPFTKEVMFLVALLYLCVCLCVLLLAILWKKSYK